ncbi:FliM/FliN family flagellar motor switch protein [Dyella sp.]|uniref:FliM/FliN family flagellar motor switch protein n=1 Tax=Dyella sp. TaxID=1869338 RepID=UPI002ED22C8A
MTTPFEQAHTGTERQPQAAHGEDLHACAQALLSRGNLVRVADERGALDIAARLGQSHAAALPSVCLESAQGSVLLALEREDGVSSLGDLHWQDYEGDARLLAWSLAHETCVDMLGQVLGGAFLPRAFAQAAPTSDLPRLWLGLSFHAADGNRSHGWLGLGAAQVRALAAHPQWLRDPSRVAILGDVELLQLELVLPCRHLEADHIDSLIVGDTLVLGDADGCHGFLRPTAVTAATSFGLPDRWTVLRRQNQWTIASQPAHDDNDWQRLHCVLATLSLPADRVGLLQPGYVLDCDASLHDAAVDIRLGDRHIGHGHLVALGSWLGARIMHKDTAHGFQ